MGEDKYTEWKESWRDEYLKWICGFANAQGGTLEIGRDDKGKIVGVSRPAKLLKDLPNKIRDILGIIPEIDQVKKQGKSLIVIKIKPYKHPVNYKGSFYYRSGSVNQELRGSALHHFLLRKIGKTWDSIPIEGGSVSSLSATAMARFRKMAVEKKRLAPGVLKETNNNLIKKLQLKEGNQLKRAAVLLFHPEPEAFFTGACVKIGYFANDADILYHDVVQGDLFTQVDKTMDLLLTKYLKAFISYEGLYRKETYPVPADVLREAVLNAVIHKDYTTGAPVQIRVYENKIVIWNNSRFPYNWTVKKLLSKHISEPFNPDIAKVFFLSGMIEAWGRGIEKMIEGCKAHGVPKPVFRGEPTGLWVQFKNHDADMREKLEKEKHKANVKSKQKAPPKTPLKAPLKASPKTPLKAPPKMTLKAPLKMTLKTPLKTPPKMTLKILEMLTENPDMTIPKLAQKINKSESAIKRSIRKLKRENCLKRIGPDKGGYWKVMEKQK